MDTNIILGSAQSSFTRAASIAPTASASKMELSDSDARVANSSSVTRKELESAVKEINEAAQSTQRNLDFSIDDITGETIVKVIATDSGEVIRQIPSEVAVKLAQSFKETNSLLFSEKI
ncbi:flagellar protein FlaG [Pseudomonas luteola]|uniref:flagellar protein FlaG n=1 Tax=Pseudomonas luteola TaxID=47886 RepID=UPI000F77E968|nr:flagellar protein FlaG [Pseudomonas luteola]RRW46105.1 flagellar protein FlaG [Pseudomonas luteola]